MARGARELGPALAGAVACAGSWGVIALVPTFHRWLVGDVPLYRAWGTATVAGQLPYRDFPFDYPPGAIPPFVGPVYLRKLAGYHGTYEGWFRVELLVLGLATVAAAAWALRSLEASAPTSTSGLRFSRRSASRCYSPGGSGSRPQRSPRDSPSRSTPCCCCPSR
jgi:hypothetical protein